MKNNFSKFAYNLLLSFIITILFICFEQIFRIYNNILVFNLDIKSFIEQLILNLAIISIIRSRAIFVIYIILAMFTWFQLLHFSYFGTWI
ncbi:hypothetical protein ACN4FT_04625, partial [Aliarcobacter butzleri]